MDFFEDDWQHGLIFSTFIKSPIVGFNSNSIRLIIKFSAKFYIPNAVQFRRFKISIDNCFVSNLEIFSTEFQDFEFGFTIPYGFILKEELLFELEAEEIFIPSDEDNSCGDICALLCIIKNFDCITSVSQNLLQNSFIHASRDSSKKIFEFNKLEDGEESCCDRLYLKLRKVISAKLPFSLIRLGDGEGRILGYEYAFNQFSITNEVFSYQFGVGFYDSIINTFGSVNLDNPIKILQQHLIYSIKNANMVFIPSEIHFSEINSVNLNSQLGQACSVNALLHHNPELMPHVEDHFIFRSFYKLGYFNKLFNNINSLTVISHSDISTELKAVFNLTFVNFIKIPGHASFMSTDSVHFPGVYQEIIKSIIVSNKGDLFLVAAGYLGKLYCNVIKQRGGIALDIGSVFDGWVGIGRPDATSEIELKLI